MMYLALAYSANIGGTGTIIGWYTSQTKQSMVVSQPKTKTGTFVFWYITQTKESLVGEQPKLNIKILHFYMQFTIFLVSDITLTNEESFSNEIFCSSFTHLVC